MTVCSAAQRDVAVGCQIPKVPALFVVIALVAPVAPKSLTIDPVANSPTVVTALVVLPVAISVLFSADMVPVSSDAGVFDRKSCASETIVQLKTWRT